MKEIVIQIPIYKTAVLIYWGNRKGLYKAVKRFDLINGIRDGWCKSTKNVLLNYKGQWYEIDKGSVFKKKWLEDNIR